MESFTTTWNLRGNEEEPIHLMYQRKKAYKLPKIRKRQIGLFNKNLIALLFWKVLVGSSNIGDALRIFTIILKLPKKIKNDYIKIE